MATSSGAAEQEDMSTYSLHYGLTTGSRCCHSDTMKLTSAGCFSLVWTVNLEKHSIKARKEMTMTALCLAQDRDTEQQRARLLSLGEMHM